MPKVAEASFVVRKKVGRVFFSLLDRFAQEHKRPGDVDVFGSLPLTPDSFEGNLSSLGHRAVEQAMSRGFDLVEVAHFAMGGDAHALKPRAYGEPLIEGQPGECLDLLRSSIVPDSGNHLGCG